MNIYIHIPFCRKKCYYCDFTTFEGSHNHKKYIEYLKKEISLYDISNVDTLYFGGGTPSYIDPKYINELIESLDINKDAEITMEFNPEDNLDGYKYINRASIGIQTFNDSLLKTLGRTHDSKKAIDFYNRARSFFDNISVDLMFALPGQSIDDLKRDLKILKELSPDHISIYSLIWKDDTVFKKKLDKGILKEMPSDLEAECYELIIDELTEDGYEHYEISSFCKKGKESKHNLIYWKNREYIGLGLGASSYYENRRYSNFRSFSTYYDSLNKNKKPIESIEAIDRQKREEYDLILKLRLKEGIPAESVSKEKREILDRYIYLGLIEKRGNYKLSRKGFLLANEVFVDLLE